MTTDSGPAWWKHAVFYQIYPRSFQDSNRDGIGDLAGIESRLDYLSRVLGVDVVWLSPFYPSPMADFGYDVADLTGIEPIFGTLKTFQSLLEQVHLRGLKMIIDLVPNHTSDQHPWFRDSRSSTTASRRDWYVWKDPGPDGAVPNNWLSIFGGSAWEWDAPTGQYYLHSFLREQPDLNWRNPRVEQAVFDAVRTWLDRGVDGFRVDAAHWILKDPQFRDNPPNPDPSSYHKSLGPYDRQLHLYDKAHPDVHGVYRRMRRLLEAESADRERFMVGEIHIYDLPELVRYYGEDLDEFHMPFNFSLLKTAWDADSVASMVDEIESILPRGAWPNYVLGNHDEARLATRLGPENAGMAAMLLLTLRGTPTLYYGDEIGMSDVSIPAGREQDPWGKRMEGLGRDGCRTPMHWERGPNAGFSGAPEADLWLPQASNHQTHNVQTQREDADSVLNLYRRILAFRKGSPALYGGDYRRVHGVPQECFAYIRSGGGQKLLVIHNFGGREAGISCRGWERVVLATLRRREGESTPGRVSVEPHQSVVLAE